ncbi:MAG: class I SAM-dependent methyltransferase [Epibacterium sp.]|nr:class I SAM-dependent methyltransferase [Epibacterium sp.]NQX71975.1 class I SAM-dependent methyltransferase [Epibacterium sp.]
MNVLTKTDTAHQHWSKIWDEIEEGSKWLTPEPDVKRWAEGLSPDASILDLGAGVGRHALALQAAGFDLTALDAAPEGLAEIDKAGTGVKTRLGRMDDLPFEDAAFDHVLSWNVIYHGDETVLLNTISEVRRVLKPGGTFMLTMLSKRRLWIDREKLNGPKEISRNTWVFDEEGSDKRHPHYYCGAVEMLALFQGFEVMWMEDREHEKPGSWHWHLTLERQA